MTDGLGAGFAALTLVTVIAGAAALALAGTGVALLIHRRAGRVPPALPYPFVALLAIVGAVSGFGVLAMYDEAARVAWLLGMLVLVPLVGGITALERLTDRGHASVAAAAMMAWSGPFLVGLVLVIGGVAQLDAALGLGPPTVRRLAWASAGLGGVAIALATAWLGVGLAARLDLG